MNKKRKNKKKNLIISFLLLIILVGFDRMMMVSSSGTWDQNSKPIWNGSKFLTNNCTGTNKAYGGFYPAYGVRFSLVDKSGNMIGNRIVDVWGDNMPSQSIYGNPPIYMYNGKANLKKDVGATSGAVSSYNDLWKMLDANDGTSGNLVIFISNTVTTYYPKFALNTKYTFTTPTFSGNDWSSSQLDSKNGWNGLSSAIEATKNLWNGYKGTADEDALDLELRKFFGGGTSNPLSSIDYANAFIQIEPLALIATHQCGTTSPSAFRIYYGTISELAMIADFHGTSASSWSKNPAEYYYESYFGGTGIAIRADTDYPSAYSVGSSNNPSFSEFKSNISGNGYGVSHIYLKDFFDRGTKDCEAMLEEVVHENSGKYKVGESSYDEAITAIREGDTNFEFEDSSGKKFKIDQAYNDTRENFWLFKENYDKRTDSRDPNPKRAQCEIREADCDTAVNYLNNWGGSLTPPAGVTDPGYKDAIKAITEGKWFYYASTTEGGAEVWDYFLIDQAYPTSTNQGLDPAIYGDDKAYCSPAEEKDCEYILNYIHSHPSEFGDLGTPKYHDSIASIVDGSFKYEEKDAAGKVTNILKIDGPYSFNMLLKANYQNGQAACEDKDDDECGVPPIIKVDPCETGYSYYKDSANEENWLECGIAYVDGELYTSENTGHVATDDTASSYTNNVVGNKEYCRVFCYEEVETTFPTSVTGVKAGQIFFWGQAYPTFGSVKVHKHCSTREQDNGGESGEGYLFKAWEKDYKANEKSMIENYLQKGAIEEAMEDSNIHPIFYDQRCGVSVPPWIPCPFYVYTCTVSTNSGVLNHDPISGEEGAWIGNISKSKSLDVSSGWVFGSSVADACDVATVKLKQQLTNELSGLDGLVNQAKENEKKLIEKIEQCTLNLKYEYKTIVYFTFKEPANGAYNPPHERVSWDYDQKFESEPAPEDGYNQDNVDTSQCEKETVYKYTCSGSKKDADCEASPYEVWDCEQVTWDIEGTWTYNYGSSEKFEWWSLKTNNKLVNTEHKDAEMADEVFFYTLGYGLPTALTLPNGVYKDLKTIVSNLGDNAEITDADDADYNIPDGHFGPVANDVVFGGESGKGFEYECTYEVKNDIFGYDCKYDGGSLTSNSPHYCDPTEDENPNGELIGIDVAYRLVSLLNPGDDISKAFPGQGGTGRGKGSNWQEVEGNIPDILRADVYQQDRNGQPNLAMYEIFLDVGTLMSIREENESLGDKAYGSFEYVKCYGDGDKKYCASEFVSKLHNGVYGNQLEGTCLTTSDTAGRAQDVYNSGCNGSYSFNFSWARS